jgi:hypothetical protein
MVARRMADRIRSAPASARSESGFAEVVGAALSTSGRSQGTREEHSRPPMNTDENCVPSACLGNGVQFVIGVHPCSSVANRFFGSHSRAPSCGAIVSRLLTLAVPGRTLSKARANPNRLIIAFRGSQAYGDRPSACGPAQWAPQLASGRSSPAGFVPGPAGGLPVRRRLPTCPTKARGDSRWARVSIGSFGKRGIVELELP